MTPLRILFVVPDLAVGGAERHVATLLPLLDRTRFAPMVVCIGEEGPLFADVAAAGMPAVALHRTKREAPAALRELVRLMRRFAPDVVVTRGYNAETLGRIAATIARVPRQVVWVHNHGDTAPRGRLRKLQDRLLDRVTDAYFGVAQAQREYLTGDLGHAEDKVRIVHNGVDPGVFDPGRSRPAALAAELGIGQDDPVVGIVAAMRPEKDHALLVRAARRVVDAVPNARFLLVGDGPERPRIEKLVADLGLAEHVLLTGVRSDVADLLAVIDVITLTSYSVECFPMALLEAMAAGRPAVCTAVGGVPEMVDDGVTGLLVAPHDETGYADAVLALLRDPTRRAAFGAAARQRVETEFSLATSVERAAGELERVAGRGTPVNLAVVMDLTFVGGAERVLLDTMRHVDPQRVAPRLICLREEGPLADEFRAAGIPVEVIRRRGPVPLDDRLPRLVRALRRHRIDVVLVSHHHRAALLLGRMAARVAGARSVVAAHDMDLTSVGRRCLPRSTVATLRASAALVLLAPSQGEYLHREEGVGRFPWRRTREVVIGNGIVVRPPTTSADRELARSELGLATDDVAVGVVARLSEQKAHHVLFAALGRIADPRVRLVVIGDGPRRAELEQLVGISGLAGRVTFTGLRRDVPALLPGLDVAALSSVHEGVPLIVIEAMAAGLPVVATRCGALADLVVDGVTGHLVPVGDDAALAARLAELAADPDLRARFGAAGRDRAVHHHDIRATARGYEELLASVTSGREHP